LAHSLAHLINSILGDEEPAVGSELHVRRGLVKPPTTCESVKPCGRFAASLAGSMGKPTKLDFSQLAAWQAASLKGSMGTPSTFFGSVCAAYP
jgi:hypothetical protein